MWWSKPKDPRQYRAPAGVPTPTQDRHLVLYKFDSCPYCVRVFRVIDELSIEVSYKDTRTEPGVRTELAQRNGTTQVPCLFIDGVPLLESADIEDWLRAYAIRYED